MLLGDSLGRKYPPYVIVKIKPSKVSAPRADNTKKRHGFGKRMGKTFKPLQHQHNIVLYATTNGWWYEGLTVAFFASLYWEESQYDSASATEAVLTCAKDLNVDCFNACTSRPADIAWKCPLKMRLRERWIIFLESQMEMHEVAMATSTPFNIMPMSRANAIELFADPWGDLSADTIANEFGCVLKGSGDDNEATVQIDGIADQLELLGLTDEHIGKIDPEQDVIDILFHGLEYAVVRLLLLLILAGARVHSGR
ncbi:Hypothetical protein PHPALM_7281 [Phytophthora palmivora]|uniref:Uncharacterized protein n=1 Tax=Phytophthora palmivora TaxID=4796 RepID=A0A2P4YCQ3_9STRA|nr:Hypothetical protein PHPALM_7281 [Phytophthora palmivora]